MRRRADHAGNGVVLRHDRVFLHDTNSGGVTPAAYSCALTDGCHVADLAGASAGTGTPRPSGVNVWLRHAARTPGWGTTPHVSGAAAILAQRHPDWSGAQLKEALMSSAKGLAAG
ncbi:S8 family serine peptidase [Micromonospora sp. NPDC048930]|uniref:S8 family serine peptidase n=1 Tax=Micromonospora sp. NPDC048930 TaxID=3364261 RepID=UPI0037211CCA